MSRSRPVVFAAVITLAVVGVVIGIVAATRLTGDTRSGIFPGRLGDMSLAGYTEGPAAVAEVTALHANDPAVRVQNAYLARYTGPASMGARFWVSESATADEAAWLLEAMARTVGDSGVFSRPSPVPAEGTTIYFVQGPPEMGLYNYLYAIGTRVFWVQVDSPDQARRSEILAEAIRRIGD